MCGCVIPILFCILAQYLPYILIIIAITGSEGFGLAVCVCVHKYKNQEVGRDDTMPKTSDTRRPRKVGV